MPHLALRFPGDAVHAQYCFPRVTRPPSVPQAAEIASLRSDLARRGAQAEDLREQLAAAATEHEHHVWDTEQEVEQLQGQADVRKGGWRGRMLARGGVGVCGNGGTLAPVGYHRAWTGAEQLQGPANMRQERGNAHGGRGLGAFSGQCESCGTCGTDGYQLGGVEGAVSGAAHAVADALALALRRGWEPALHHFFPHAPATVQCASLLAHPDREPSAHSPATTQILAAEVEHLHVRLTAAVADKDAALAAGLGRLEADLAAVTDERDDLAQRMRFLERQLHK